MSLERPSLSPYRRGALFGSATTSTKSRAQTLGLDVRCVLPRPMAHIGALPPGYGCQWIEREGEHYSDADKCRDKLEPGSSYCLEHSKRAYQKGSANSGRG